MRLGSRRQLGHPMVIVSVVIIARGRSRLVGVGVFRWIELVGRPITGITVLFHVRTTKSVGTGFHRDVGVDGVGGLVEAVVAGSVDLLGLGIR